MSERDQPEIKSFENMEVFYAWLERNHSTYTALWMKIYKKSSGIVSINWEESVKAALCWGWIDGQKKSLDKDSYLQRFTPRRAKSNWSKRNTEHVETLIARGLMQEAGMVHVRSAQADGRWEAAYAPMSEMVMPEDFLSALDSNLAAKTFFESLNKSSKFIIASSLQSAKKVETRERRFNKFLAMLEEQKKP